MVRIKMKPNPNNLPSPFIIAEAGINHNGDIHLAKKMIDVAVESGASAIKFQKFKAEEFCGDESQQFTYQSQGKSVTESMLEMFRRYEFEDNEWVEISKYAKNARIDFFATPQNLSDLDILLEIGIDIIKIGSDDLTNTPLISEFAKQNKMLILSCGMADMTDVEKALKAAGWFEGNEVAILVCTSEYPTSASNSNILRVKTLRETFPGLTVGFSDHTQGNISATMSVALGATIFEKHFTLDHELPGPDHWFSCNPSELKTWVSCIKESFESLGDGEVRPTENEMAMRKMARRSVIALMNISKGEKFSTQNTGLRRPGGGIPPEKFSKVLGKEALKDISKGELLSFDHFREELNN